MKMNMKNIGLLFFVLAFVVSCVDDYTDANPRRRLDAPTIRISAAGENQEIVTIAPNRFQTTALPFISDDGPTEFTVTVVDAPGKVGTVSVTPSVPEFGEVTLNAATVTALQGQEQGEFKFTYTPTPTPPDLLDRPLNLVIEVSDSQVDEDGEANPKTTTLTVPTTIVDCVHDVEEGTYRVTAASGNLDGGTAYTLADLETDFGGEILVEITKDSPGHYTMDEVTGGVWPTYYSGRANPALGIVFCSDSFYSYPALNSAGAGPIRTFDIDGTINGNGTLTITWSYFRADGPTPANPAKGTYTLTKVQ
jgi:hypothetical protein